MPIILSLFAVLLYLITAAPFMLWLDAPRFISAIVTLGIANPPEPLYVLLAHPFTYLPFGSVIFKIQLFSALTAAVTLLLLYRLILLILKNLGDQGNQGDKVKTLAAVFGTAALAFSYQFWSQAQNVENFILVTLIEVVVLYLILTINSKKGMLINLSLVAVILGLATGTNPVIASVVPAILWMMWVKRKHLPVYGFPIWIVLGIVAIILIHLYIPIRASANPFLNYWRATDFQSVWNASTGAGLNVYVPSLGRINGFTLSPEIFFQSSFNFIKNLFLKFTPLLLPFIVLGGIYLWKKGRYFFFLLFSIVMTNFIFSGLYFSGNQESWFLVSDVAWVIMAGLGFYWLVTEPEEIFPKKLYKFYKNYNSYKYYIALLVLLPLIIWFPFLNRRGWVITADYIDNLYRPMRSQKAILFGSSDLYDSVSFYVHDVKGTPHYNPEIVPITDNLLYIYQWYRDNITSNADIKMPEASGLKYNSIHEYSNFVNAFFEMNMDKYKIYVTIPALRNNFLLAYGEESDSGSSLKIDETKFKVVPQGMLLQVLPKEATDEPDLKNFDYQFKSRGFPKKKPFLLEKTFATELTGVLNEYAYSLETLGDYYLKQNKPDKVLDLYQRALDFNPRNAEVISRLGNYYGSTGNHAKAAEYFEKALKIEPKNIGLLFNSAIAYANTGRIDKAIKNLNLVLQFSKGNSQIAQLARAQLDALKQATPSAQVATGSGDLQSQLLPKTPAGAGVYQNQALNLAFNYPKGYTVSEESGVVTLTNNLKNQDELTLNFYGRKMKEGEEVEKLTDNLPFKIDGAQLLSQPISLAGFAGVGKTIGSGEHLTFVLLLRKNDQGLVIKVYPGDTAKTEEFNQILSSISTLR